EQCDSTAKIGNALLVPKVSKAIQALTICACRYRPINAVGGTYKVKLLKIFKEYVVSLEKETCSYHVYQFQGFPCSHAINIILSKQEILQKYVKPLFTVTTYTHTYNTIFPSAASKDLDTPCEFEDTDVALAWLAGDVSNNNAGIED